MDPTDRRMALAFFPVKPALWTMLIPTFGQQLLINQFMRGEAVAPLNALVASAVTLVAVFRNVASVAIVGGGTLGILIPPSVTMIVYGIATQTSVGKLFIAGVIPGIIMTLLFAVWVILYMLLKKRALLRAGARSSDHLLLVEE